MTSHPTPPSGTDALPQWLISLAGDTTPKQLDALMKLRASHQLAQLRGERPPRPSDALHVYGTGPSWVAGLIQGLHGRADRRALLDTLLQATAFSSGQMNVSGLTLAVSGWSGDEVISALGPLRSKGGMTHSARSYNDLPLNIVLDSLLKAAHLSDLLRHLAGLETGAVQATLSAQEKVVSGAVVNRALRRALDNLRPLPLSREQRHSALEASALSVKAGLRAQLRHWTILFPESRDPDDLTPALRDHLTRARTRSSVIQGLAEMQHPLAEHLHQAVSWHADLTPGPLPTLERTWTADTLSPGPAQTAQARDVLTSLQRHLTDICPPRTSRQELRGKLTTAVGDTSMAHLLVCTLAGHLSGHYAWPKDHADLSLTLRQWTLLSRALPDILRGELQAPQPVIGEISGPGTHEQTLLTLCRAGWPISGLILTLNAQVDAKFSESGAEDGLNPQTVTADHGEALLAYWEAMAVTTSTKWALLKEAQRHHPQLEVRAPRLTYHTDPGVNLSRTGAQGAAQAVSLALLRRAATTAGETP